jgi:hypothetical protein
MRLPCSYLFAITRAPALSLDNIAEIADTSGRYRAFDLKAGLLED